MTNEEDLDKQFFSKNEKKNPKDAKKLNKAEKRALKFMLKREGADGVDISQVVRDNDTKQLQEMIKEGNEPTVVGQYHNQVVEHKKYVETGGGQKRLYAGVRATGNNSNKQWDFTAMIKDDSD